MVIVVFVTNQSYFYNTKMRDKKKTRVPRIRKKTDLPGKLLKRLNVKYKAGDLSLLNKVGILPKLTLLSRAGSYLIEKIQVMAL